VRLQHLIDKLKSCKQDAPVRWDFGGLGVTHPDSWRGVYAELALGWTDSHSERFKTVGELTKALEKCIGQTFDGYKGGDFEMDMHTRVHCDNYGHCTNTSVVGVLDEDYVVTLETRYTP